MTRSECGDSVKTLNVKYSLASRLVSGLSGPARMTCMTTDADQLHPPPGDVLVSLETACLKLTELPEVLAIVQAARRGASDSNRHSRASPGGKGKSRQPFGRQRVPNNASDQRQSGDRQLRSSEELNDLGHSPDNEEARICKQSWTNERHAASVMRVDRPDIRQEILNAQVVLSM